jgi:hypothetical protein
VSLVVSFQSGAQRWKLLVSLQSSEASGRFQHGGRGPAHRHRGRAPSLHVPAYAPHRAHGILDDVGTGERAPRFASSNLTCPAKQSVSTVICRPAWKSARLLRSVNPAQIEALSARPVIFFSDSLMMFAGIAAIRRLRHDWEPELCRGSRTRRIPHMQALMLGLDRRLGPVSECRLNALQIGVDVGRRGRARNVCCLRDLGINARRYLSWIFNPPR